MLNDDALGFSFTDAIKRSKGKKLLEGLKIYATPSIAMPALILKEIIGAAGGEHVLLPPSAKQENMLIVSCEADSFYYQPLVALGYTIYKLDFFIQGVLEQTLNFNANKLEIAPPKRTTRRSAKS